MHSLRSKTVSSGGSPVATSDPDDHRNPDWPRIGIPMLMMNGTLDIETPLPTALVAHDHYHGGRISRSSSSRYRRMPGAINRLSMGMTWSNAAWT
ncbi:MAG: hypothetical protein ABI591_10650 [Kofleriaceae bacterium]